jgi:2-amino-4-hydroxy-6-hydroxymethyldihydropteridine diphosphokinase
MILLAIGANLPGANLPGADAVAPLRTCRRAVASLAALPGLALVGLSRWYGSSPVLAPGQDRAGQLDYVNGVARLSGRIDPADLLARLHAIEASFGRVRTDVNAPRTLDLDIIAIDGLVRDAPDPILPHPRAHLRGFVLYPLAEVAPDWVHPRLGQSMASLLAALPPQDVRPLYSASPLLRQDG